MSIRQFGSGEMDILITKVCNQLRQVQAYIQMIKLSQELSICGMTAAELYQASRNELEAKGDFATPENSPE